MTPCVTVTAFHSLTGNTRSRRARPARPARSQRSHRARGQGMSPSWPTAPAMCSPRLMAPTSKQGCPWGGSYVADRKERGTPRKGSSGILFPKHVCPHRPGSPRHRHCWKCPNYAICPTDPLPARALHRAPQQPCPQATCSDTHTRVVLFSDDSGNHSRSEGQVMHHPTGSSSNNPDPGLNPTGGFPAPRGDLLLPT